jgi:predicted RNA binding protein YcfA (HicA-like mRNA interferase family)
MLHAAATIGLAGWAGIFLDMKPIKVRELLRLLEQDGWYQARMRGSHRVLKHPEKPGIVVVPGSLGDSVAPGTVRNVLKQAQLEDEP